MAYNPTIPVTRDCRKLHQPSKIQMRLIAKRLLLQFETKTVHIFSLGERSISISDYSAWTYLNCDFRQHWTPRREATRNPS